jgi:hypothetical protein
MDISLALVAGSAALAGLIIWLVAAQGEASWLLNAYNSAMSSVGSRPPASARRIRAMSVAGTALLSD